MTLTAERMNEIGQAFLSQSETENLEEVKNFMQQLGSTELMQQLVPGAILRIAQTGDPVGVLVATITTAVEFGIAVGKATADCACLESLVEKEN